MTPPKLTQKAIDAALPDGAGPWRMLWDHELPGFGVRVMRSGHKAFTLRYRTREGAQRMESLGDVRKITLAEARRLARERLADVVKGGDPVQERREARAALSVAELSALYLEHHCKPRKASYPDDAQRFRSHVIPAFGERKATDLTAAEVAAFHRRIGTDRGLYTANRTLSLLGAMYAWALREGRIPAGTMNPARGVQKYREQSRARWLTPEEVRRVFGALKTESNPYVRGFFALALLTGLRKRELLGARWADVSDGLLRVPRTKNRQPHLIPLSREAATVLESLPREYGNGHVFPGQRDGEPLCVATIDQAWRRIRAAAGVDDAHVHDLRRTLGSWLVQGGVSLHLVGRALNHESAEATRVYARFALENVRTALDAHGAAVRDAGLGALLEAGE